MDNASRCREKDAQGRFVRFNKDDDGKNLLGAENSTVEKVANHHHCNRHRRE
jgi:hypothetical protein